MKSTLLFYLINVTLLSCNFQNKNAHQPNSNDSYFMVEDMKIDSKVCNCGKNNSLLIRSNYFLVDDSISLGGILVSKQELFFIKNNIVSSIKIPPFRTQKIKIKEDTAIVQATNLSGVKCIKKDSGYVYLLYGINTFDPPHEFFALCSIKGDWLWYYYGNMNETFSSFGNKQKYEEFFGDEISNLNGMINIP